MVPMGSMIPVRGHGGKHRIPDLCTAARAEGTLSIRSLHVSVSVQRAQHSVSKRSHVLRLTSHVRYWATAIARYSVPKKLRVARVSRAVYSCKSCKHTSGSSTRVPREYIPRVTARQGSVGAPAEQNRAFLEYSSNSSSCWAIVTACAAGMLAWRGVEDFSAVGTETDVDVYAHTNANARDVPSSLQHDKEKRWRRRKWTRVSRQKCCERTYYSLPGSGRMYRRSRTPPYEPTGKAAVSAVLRLVIMVIIIDELKRENGGVGSCYKACCCRPDCTTPQIRKYASSRESRRHSRVCVPRLSVGHAHA